MARTKTAARGATRTRQPQNSRSKRTQTINPFLWFDSQAEAAAKLYVSIFPNSRILGVSRYGDAGPGPKGTVMTVTFELDGQRFIALNGGPQFKFTEAISFSIECETQEEVDYYWNKLGAGGDPQAQQCGWVKDKFGVSWQVVPRILSELIVDPDQGKAERAFEAMLQMKKIDIAELKRATETAGAKGGR
jgi:predicted 3-demethylubiquinone-9 3-methyltransferase (glyoxalase superfamily)